MADNKFTRYRQSSNDALPLHGNHFDARPRFLLRPEYPQLKHKKVYRLYREANLAVRRRKKIGRPASKRQALSPPMHQCGVEHGFREPNTG